MKKLICIVSAIFMAFVLLFQTAVVTTSSINLRETPVSGDVIEVIPQGTTLELKNCQGDWCVTSYANANGYVNKKYVKETSPNEVYTTTIPTIQSIIIPIQTAIRYHPRQSMISNRQVSPPNAATGVIASVRIIGGRVRLLLTLQG